MGGFRILASESHSTWMLDQSGFEGSEFDMVSLFQNLRFPGMQSARGSSYSDYSADRACQSGNANPSSLRGKASTTCLILCFKTSPLNWVWSRPLRWCCALTEVAFCFVGYRADLIVSCQQAAMKEQHQTHMVLKPGHLLKKGIC